MSSVRYASSSSRSRRASAGLVPDVDAASVIFPLRTTAGRMKSQFAGSSAAFTQRPRCLACAATSALIAPSSVATITHSQPPSRSDSTYARATCLMRPASTCSRSSGISSGLTTVMSASAASSPRTFSAPTPPADHEHPPPLRLR